MSHAAERLRDSGSGQSREIAKRPETILWTVLDPASNDGGCGGHGNFAQE
jgi:hypothetical protein